MKIIAGSALVLCAVAWLAASAAAPTPVGALAIDETRRAARRVGRAHAGPARPNPQEPVNLYYPGDDLFTQLFGNVYLDRFDHLVTEVLRAPYVRYVDDFALFADDAARLEAWRGRLAAFLAHRRLSLHSAKTHVAATSARRRVTRGEQRVRAWVARPAPGGSCVGSS